MSERLRLKSYREVVLDLAADLLRRMGYADLAKQVATVEVPLVDGYVNLLPGRKIDANGLRYEVDLVVDARQAVRPSDGPMFVLAHFPRQGSVSNTDETRR